MVRGAAILLKIKDVDFENEGNTEKYALCLFNTGSSRETKQFIDSVMDKYPDNQLLNRLLGRLLIHLNDHVEGLRYLQKGAGMIEFDQAGVRYLN